jgi:hypothetical protein
VDLVLCLYRDLVIALAEVVAVGSLWDWSVKAHNFNFVLYIESRGSHALDNEADIAQLGRLALCMGVR